MQVEVDEGAGDEDVDNGEGVGDYAGGGGVRTWLFRIFEW